MSKKINNIHDKFFKSIMSDINLARAFMQQFLPEEVLSSLILETLEISNQSFIDEKLNEAFSDAVFKVKLKSMIASVYISILLEHKSYKEEFTPFQILLYQANGYLQQLKSGEPLKIILPVVYYHGKEAWELKRVADFFSEHPPVLKKFIPDFSMEYIDLVRMDDTALYRLQNTLLASALLLQRYSHQPKALHEEISRIFNTINSNTSGNFIQTLLVYSMHVLNVEDS